MTSPTASPADFPPTRWSVVAAAGEQPARHWRFSAAAIGDRCTPMPAVAVISRPMRRISSRRSSAACWKTASWPWRGQERGRFRSFLLTALRHFLADAHDHASAAKRDRKRLVWLDGLSAEARYQLEPASTDDAELLFDRTWAVTIIDETLKTLQEECAAKGQSSLFAACRPVLTGQTEDAALATVVSTLAMQPGTAKVALHRLRCRWRDLLRRRVADTVADDAEVEDELRHLIAVMGHAPR